MSIDLRERLTNVIATPGDINRHLITLMTYAAECNSILECGVRSVVSTWAFLHGLTLNRHPIKKLSCCDLVKSPSISDVEKACAEQSISFTFYEMNNLEIPMENTSYNMLFIDTWHIYGHLKRELEKFESSILKYIILHDTEVDKIHGESIRCGWDTRQQAIESGYPEEEIRCGLQKAVDEFLQTHSDWVLKEHISYNNGLTVLERIRF